VPDTDTDLLTSQDPSSPHLSRLVWLGEQLQSNAAELTELFRANEGIQADLNDEEFTALRAAAAAARTAGGDVVLIATAAHQRTRRQPQHDLPSAGGARD
jgi:hypothetical protein